MSEHLVGGGAPVRIFFAPRVINQPASCGQHLSACQETSIIEATANLFSLIDGRNPADRVYQTKWPHEGS